MPSKKEYSLSVKGLDAIRRIQEDYCKKQKQELIEEFLEDLKEKDNKIDCKYRGGGIPGEPCEQCTNYKYCEECNYPIIKKWERMKE